MLQLLKKSTNIPGRRLVGFFLAVSGLALLLLGLPRFMHELMLVPGTPIYARLMRGQAVTDQELSTLEKSRIQALEYSEKPHSYSVLGAVYLTRARRTDQLALRQELAAKAVDVLKKSVVAMPLDSTAWARITSAYLILGQDYVPDALEAWRKSIVTAKFEPIQQPMRVHLGIILYEALTPNDISMLKQQLESDFRWNERHICRYMRDNNLLDWAIFLSPAEGKMATYFAAGECK